MEFLRLIVLLSCVSAAGSVYGSVSFSDGGYSQDFDALPVSGAVPLRGSSSVGAHVPIPGVDGWYMANLEDAGDSGIVLTPDRGDALTGGLFSFGNPESTDRALGLLYSNARRVAVGAVLVNDTGATIHSLRVTYDHEIWSVQAAAERRRSLPFHDILEFAYGFGSEGVDPDSFLTSGAIVRHAKLDAISYSHRGHTNARAEGPSRVRDGASDAWRERRTSVLTGLDWAPGDTLFIRWQDGNSGDWRGPMNDFNAAHGIDSVTIEIDDADPAPAASRPDGILVDGDFSDWEDSPFLYTDATHDAEENGVDFQAVGGYVSTVGLAVYLRSAQPLDLADSPVLLGLDTDGDAGTGTLRNGIGIDVSLSFAATSTDDRFYPAEVRFVDTGDVLRSQELVVDILPNILRTRPTTSNRYEMLIPLSALPDVEPGGRVGILLSAAGSDDIAPDLNEVFFVDVPEDVFIEHEIASLGKLDPADVRIATWNVYRDTPRDPDKEPSFGRLLQATAPDIINFQELYGSTTQWTAALVNRWLPLPDGEEWMAAKNADCITVSRYEILGSYGIDGNLIVWIKTRDVWGFDTLIVNAHLPATNSGNQEGRLLETDNILLLLRRLLSGDDPLGPDGSSPLAVMVTGDLNARPPMPELSNMRLGRFHDEALGSLNFRPDPHNRPLADTAARHIHSRRAYTYAGFGSDRGNALPRIDQIFYPVSLLTRRRAYIVDTVVMSDDFLEQYRLEKRDSSQADHLLVIGDFRPRTVDRAGH